MNWEAMAQERLVGKLLVATPALREPPFARAVVALLDHNEDGALGVVINSGDGAALVDVVPTVADLASDPAVLFCGGPVEPTTAIALGVTTGEVADGLVSPVLLPLVTVDLDADPTLLAASLRQLRVFVGYAGWGAGQLEGEIEQGAWYVVQAQPGDPFDSQPEQLWSAVLRRQPWPLSAVSTCPLDPTMN